MANLQTEQHQEAEEEKLRLRKLRYAERRQRQQKATAAVTKRIVAAALKRTYHAIDAISQEPIVTNKQLLEALGTTSYHSIYDFLQRCEGIPWLTVETFSRNRRRFIVNRELRTLCEFNTNPNGLSVADFLINIRNEIKRRKSEGYLEVINLLNWIEEELGKIC
jgi:hypothetical protein